MFKTNLASYPYVSPVGSYTENLGRAAHNFITALLAIEPANVTADSSIAQDIEKDPAETFAELDQLAHTFDTIMPNQAAELRYLLSRD